MDGLILRGIVALVAAVSLAAAGWYVVSLIKDNASKGAVIAQNEASIKENKKAVSQKVKNETYFQAMDTSQLDALGRSNGWLRQDSDR